MQIKFTDKNNKEFSINLEDEEVQYFVEYAMTDLLRKGVLSIEEPTKEEHQLNYLKNCDVNRLPTA